MCSSKSSKGESKCIKSGLRERGSRIKQTKRTLNLPLISNFPACAVSVATGVQSCSSSRLQPDSRPRAVHVDVELQGAPGSRGFKRSRGRPIGARAAPDVSTKHGREQEGCVRFWCHARSQWRYRTSSLCSLQTHDCKTF